MISCIVKGKLPSKSNHVIVSVQLNCFYAKQKNIYMSFLHILIEYHCDNIFCFSAILQLEKMHILYIYHGLSSS